VRITIERTIREKYSGAPNRIAKSVNGAARKVSPSRLKVPAMNEPIAAIPRAGPALPCLAILYPSRQVITEVASPGMFNRIEVVDPPYCAP